VTLGFAVSAAAIGAVEVTGPITAAFACGVVPELPAVNMQATNAATKILRRIIGQPLLLIMNLAVSYLENSVLH
jgi:hypothetical protein